MRIRSTDDRERLWDDLREATGNGHTSQALDDSARLYVKLRGDTAAQPTGLVEELLREADNADGGLGPEKIAEILSTNELPVDATTSTTISVGDD